MEKLLNHLAIFDFIANIVTGITVLTFSYYVLKIVYSISINIDVGFNETVLLFIVSYFSGIILQEVSSYIQKKWIFKHRPLRVQVLSSSYDADDSLTETERKDICLYVMDIIGISEENNIIIYEYCKYYVQKNCDMSRIDRFEAISAMSRGMSLYFFVLTIISLLSCFLFFTYSRIILTFISAGLTALFYFRFFKARKRMLYLVYAYILS